MDDDNPLQIPAVFDQGAGLAPSAVCYVLGLLIYDLGKPFSWEIPGVPWAFLSGTPCI